MKYDKVWECWVFIREKFWLENSLSQIGSGYFQAKFFLYKYPNILKPCHTSYLPDYEDGTECSETSAYKIQTPGNYPEETHSVTRVIFDSRFTILFFVSV